MYILYIVLYVDTYGDIYKIYTYTVIHVKLIIIR